MNDDFGLKKAIRRLYVAAVVIGLVSGAVVGAIMWLAIQVFHP